MLDRRKRGIIKEDVSDERIEKIVAYLQREENRKDLRRNKCKIVFNFSGDHTSAKVTRIDETIEVRTTKTAHYITK